MSTTFAELKRQVLLRLFPRSDGKTLLAVEEAINEAHKTIARVKDFDELIVLDTTNASTVISQRTYHITTDLKLTRPKDIYSIRYMDEANSRKLIYVPFRDLDSKVPYTELVGTGKPKWYIRRGMYIELFKIPSEAKPLYIMHSQWPVTLSADADETPYLNLDDVIITLSADIALSIVEEGGSIGWYERARALLGASLAEEQTRPDRTYVARPFRAEDPREGFGDYWLDPFVTHQP